MSFKSFVEFSLWIKDEFFSFINIRNRLQFSKCIYSILYHTAKSWHVQRLTPFPVHYPQKTGLLNYGPFFSHKLLVFNFGTIRNVIKDFYDLPPNPISELIIAFFVYAEKYSSISHFPCYLLLAQTVIIINCGCTRN